MIYNCSEFPLPGCLATVTLKKTQALKLALSKVLDLRGEDTNSSRDRQHSAECSRPDRQNSHINQRNLNDCLLSTCNIHIAGEEPPFVGLPQCYVPRIYGADGWFVPISI